jgi:hypothetical protein
MATRAAYAAAVWMIAVALNPTPVFSDEVPTFEVTLKGDAFEPAELRVPANKPFIIKLKNLNAAPAELEAKDLKIEKVAAGNSEIVVRVKATPPGTYLFVDEYQEDVAKGYVVSE